MQLYNTLTRQKQEFQPLHAPHVGLYVCGPTVYGDPHLGHARPAITFDVLFRYLKAKDYKVRYVRNITDVGHLENDADAGEDKIAKKARLEQLEPMEVAQYYTYRYREAMCALGVLPPSIEPQASGHIIDQIELIESILKAEFAYISEGSVYFDVEKYNQSHHYGKLSGRVLEDLISNTRTLDGQDEKQKSYDFALWKKASPEHIMRWNSPWSVGFPGWHLECSAMSAKYLGKTFDIHGGGMDLIFPHHECEIAQSVAAFGHESAQLWMHNNMITINGQKMGKSLGNFITLEELFTGTHKLLQQAYNPMTIRFFILQAHYRSTLDFSNEALQAAEKGLKRLLEAFQLLEKLQPAAVPANDAIAKIVQQCYEAMDDDLNTPIAIAHLFDAVRLINAATDNREALNQGDIEQLQNLHKQLIANILGLETATASADNSQLLDGAINMLLDVRQQAKAHKDFATSDSIRNQLTQLGVTIKDGKDGSSWTVA
ncbi:cysteine--tRNA ligase [Bacteroidia bacterium]|nr:cysteine--tRNA ligase [Bacteroidia bacterium]